MAEDDRERLDLWIYDIAAAQSRRVVNAADLSSSGPLSATEKAERERKRQFSGGITQHKWHPHLAQVLIAIDGQAFLVEIASGAVTQLTASDTRQTDLSFSPDGSKLAFVRDYNLYVCDLETRNDNNNLDAQPFTTGGSALRTFGLPEFIAQEEMHRFEGYWWTPDSTALVYTEVDNKPVSISQRYEIDADELRVIAQRYPFAGAANAKVQLYLQTLAGSAPVEIGYLSAPDDYLARVQMSGDLLYVQVQSRDQQRLQLKRWRLSTLAADTADVTAPVNTEADILLTEHSSSWLNLHDNFFPLPEPLPEPQTTAQSQEPMLDQGFLWTSERDGQSHLYLYPPARPAEGKCRQLSHGACRIDRVLYADAQRAFVSGWASEPTQQHIYRCDYSTPTPTLVPLTEGNAWHEAIFSKDGEYFLDRHSNFALPAALDLVTNITPSNTTSNATSTRSKVASLAIGAHHAYAPYLESHVTPQIGSTIAADGQQLYYRLTPPAALTNTHTSAQTTTYPVVVYVYGGPGVQRVTWAWPPLLLQIFASRGFGVLELDNRGTSNRGKAFEAPIFGRLGEVEVADQLAGVELLRKIPWVDDARIGVFGHSYGGYMTLMCMSRAPGVFAAGVAVAPVSQWQLYDTHYTERYLKTPQTNPEGYHDSSVLPWLSDIRGALLIIHGMADDNVLFTHSTKLFKSLQDANLPFQMMTYPGAKHALQETSVSKHRFEMLLRFFEENL